MARFRTAVVVGMSGVLGLVACSGGADGPPGDDAGLTSSSSSSSGAASSSSSGGTPNANADASVDDASTGGATKNDAGDAGADGTTETCPVNVPLTAADLDAETGWNPALQTPDACSDADVIKLESNFRDLGITTYLGLGNGLSPSCKACTITYNTAASWGPIVATEADAGATGFINFGACYGTIEGAACGKALQYEQFCYNIACSACATTSTERMRCVQAAGAAGGMCEAFGAATKASCPNIGTTAAKCNSVVDAVKMLCGSSADGGPADASND
jgi:hypothetical protein